MKRRAFIALVGAIVVRPFAAPAQESGRMYRLGALLSTPRDTPTASAAHILVRLPDK
jgi:hypothetical protein